MKNLFGGLASAVMVIYTLYRGITTLVFLPFAGSLGSPTGLYFTSLVVIAAGATTLSFTKKKELTAFMALLIGFIAVIYWWMFICRAAVPIWSDFFWLVVPEICFALAGLCKWALTYPRVFLSKTA